MSVCVWEPSFTVEQRATWETYEASAQEQSVLLATESLLMLTYNRVGTCPVELRRRVGMTPAWHLQ